MVTDRWIEWCVVLGACLYGWAAAVQAEDAPVSPAIELLRARPSVDARSAGSGSTGSEVSEAPARVALYVVERLDATEIAALGRAGIYVNPWAWVEPVAGRHPFGFHLAHVPHEQIAALAADPRVARLDSLEFDNFPENDRSRALTSADSILVGDGVTSRTGAGVRIAVADSGLDVTHPDLPTPLEALDTTDGATPNEWGTDVTDHVLGHGTHVVATIAGNGGLSNGRYAGAAPDADLYFYKIGDDSDASASAEDMVEATLRAREVGAHILSLSYGGVRTFLDGSDPTSQAIDAAHADGVACFVAAGNSADDENHSETGPLAANERGSALYTVDLSESNVSYRETEGFIVNWRGEADPGDLTISVQGLSPTERFRRGGSDVSPRGTRAVAFEIDLAVSALDIRDYRIDFRASRPIENLHVFGIQRSPVGKFTFASADTTIVAPGLADTAIAVGAWTGRTSVRNWRGQLVSSSIAPELDAVAPFSGRGPRLDGIRKPQIVAPGTFVVSALDSVSTQGQSESFQALWIDNDGLNLDGSGPANYIAYLGTSMATPNATGASALLLEAHPSLTPDTLLLALQATARDTEAPDDVGGHGLIDVHAALLRLDEGVLPDHCSIREASGTDCDQDGIPDACSDEPLPDDDCDENGVPDVCDVGSGSAADCDADGLLDSCAIELDPALDCDGNGTPDSCDVGSGAATDCDADGLLDSCAIELDPALDCDGNGTPDSCDISAGDGTDCDSDGTLDACEIAVDPALDCNEDGAIDTCQLAADSTLDCDQSGTLDACEPSEDCNGNAVPDRCETDVALLPCTLRPFQRGDADASGDLDLSDGIVVLLHLFVGSVSLPCLDAADVDDSTNLEVTDAIALLAFLFDGGPLPAPPVSVCGTDPIGEGASTLGCETYAPCAD